MADITIHTQPDHQGRQLYTRHWISDYHPGDPAGEHHSNHNQYGGTVMAEMSPIEDEWISPDGSVRLILGDAIAVLPTLGEGEVDAVVTDPPYGIGYVKGKGGSAGAYNGRRPAAECRHHKPVHGDSQPFDPAPLLRFGNVIMWGANHYCHRLPEGGRWLAWDKLAGLESFDSFSDVEFAWHSRGKASRIVSYRWKGIASVKSGEDNGSRWHPTQKPIGVMVWCLDLVSPADVILDPYMGSGTTGVACIRTGRRFIGCEIDGNHWQTAVDRCKAELNRQPLFEPPPKAQQPLFEEIG